MKRVHWFALLAAAALPFMGYVAADTSGSLAAATPPHAPTTAASKPLGITFPAANTRVSGPIIEVTGEGADPKGQLEVSVLTNDWYLQNGTATINADGTFSYAPVYVSGEGKFNNHTVRVVVIKDGKRIASTSVAGIVRLD